MNVSIIGTGYVGLVTGTCFADMGNKVICVDNNTDKVKKLKDGEITIFEPDLDKLFLRNISKKRLSFTSDLREAVLKSDVIFLSLPTPQGEDGSADLTYVLGVANDIGDILRNDKSKDYKIIVNKSTVPVGTSKKVREAIAEKGVYNFDVVSNPEFLREGFAVADFMKPDRIVLGTTDQYAIDRMRKLYEPFVRQGNPVLVMDNESAEITKYASNSYLAMRITFMNELANFCEAAGANVDDVRKGMSTDSRIGKRFLFPGIGYGGSCFPKDVNALVSTARCFKKDLNILGLVDQVNKKQKSILVEKVLKHFNGDLKGKHFAVWGLAFKPNTDDMREAPSITIINRLLEEGATISAYDPAAKKTAEYYFKDKIKYASDEYSALNNADALLILTEWNEFRNPNFKLMKMRLKSSLIFDGRNVMELDEMQIQGFNYYSMGRKVIDKTTVQKTENHFREKDSEGNIVDTSHWKINNRRKIHT